MTQTAGPGSAWSAVEELRLLYLMQLIRRFEQRVIELVDADEIESTTHECIGQEAVAVGVCSVLRSGDAVTSTHRGHGHALAKGIEPGVLFAELLGRESGSNHGRGGSMHVTDLSRGLYGANGIVAAATPIACGLARGFMLRGLDRVVICFVGDGGINQGVLHEALNLAVIWQLPVVFICENNQYAVSTPIHSVSARSVHERAGAHGLASIQADGMDLDVVRMAVQEAVARARDLRRPSFVEFQTYRYEGHSTSERHRQVGYRTEEEIARWRTRDPIVSWTQRLLTSGLASLETIDAINGEVETVLDGAVDFARQSPWPDPGRALDHMYARPFAGLPAWGYRR